MNGVLLGVIAYLILQLGLGFYVSRKVASESDYLLAGRSLGYGLSIFTVFATWFGAETCIGSAGEAYASGLAGVTADPFGYALALLLFGLLFAVPLWRRKLTTLADLFRQRYGVAAERVAVLLMVPTSVLWAAAQIRAFGQVLGHTGGLDIRLTITIAAIVVIIYTTAGGLLADAWTDLVQGCVLIVGLIMLAVTMFAHGDGGAVTAGSAERLRLIAPDATLLSTLEAWAPPIFGSLVAQELVARALGARNPMVAKRSAIIASGMYLCIGLIPVVVGLAAAQLAPGLEDHEQVLMHQAEHYLPALGYVVFAGALVSAILSTVDSALLVAGSLLAHNLVLPLMPRATERDKLWINRAAVAGFGVIAYLLALSAESVYAMVEEASAFGSAGVFVIVVFGLYTRVGGAAAAIAALVVGAVVHGVGAHLGLLPQPYITALGCAFAVFLVIALIERALLAPPQRA